MSTAGPWGIPKPARKELKELSKLVDLQRGQLHHKDGRIDNAIRILTEVDSPLLYPQRIDAALKQLRAAQRNEA